MNVNFRTLLQFIIFNDGRTEYFNIKAFDNKPYKKFFHPIIMQDAKIVKEFFFKLMDFMFNHQSIDNAGQFNENLKFSLEV